MEKSLQRIHRGYKNAMYTSQKSIENKVGAVGGWKDLLMSVGFRFEPAANGIPAAVFFPQSDPGERLTQCSASLQAILGLSPTSWAALSSLLASPDSADEIMAVFRQVIGHFGPRDLEVESVKTPVNVRLWRVPGCHELLASLGFDLMEVGKDDVTLKTSRTANKRQIQFALQALVALFDTDEAPRSLAIDSADSLEDLRHEDDVSGVSSSSPPPPVPPFPAPRKSHLILDGSAGSAFSSYARSRGEPDGRQHPDSPPGSSSPGVGVAGQPPPPLPPAQLYHAPGRESDCNFTPSPVDQLQLRGARGGFLHGPGAKYKLGPSPLSRPGSCSSASSAQDWDQRRPGPGLAKLSPGVTDSSSSLSTLGLSGFRKYVSGPGGEGSLHPPVRSVFTEAGYYSNKAKLVEAAARTSDKLSIRAEVGGAGPGRAPPPARKKEGLAARLEPGVMARVPPTGGQDTSLVASPAPSSQDSEGVLVRTESLAGETSIKEHIISTQMRKINRELPISEVYHERSLGLGLAPPLSKLIMSNNIAVAQVDHHADPAQELQPAASPPPAHAQDNMSNFDNLSVIEDAHPSRRPKHQKRPPVPPKPVPGEPWLAAGAGLIKTDLRSLGSSGSQPPASRDDGDGRSMTDSQYSGCSPSGAQGSSKDLTTKFNYAMKIRDKTAAETSSIGTYSNVVLSQNIYSVPDTEEEGVAAPPPPPPAAVISTNIRPSDIAHYINTEFRAPQDPASPAPPPAPRPSIHTLHPQIWSKDKNGRFTYNGSLASDC